MINMRKFFDKYEFFWEYNYPFGEDFLKSIFQEKYKMKFSLTGDGIFDLVLLNDKIYDIRLSQNSKMLPNDNKKAFRDTYKDFIVEKITNKLKENNIIYTTNSGKFISFEYNNFIFKIEVVKKNAMPS